MRYQHNLYIAEKCIYRKSPGSSRVPDKRRVPDTGRVPDAGQIGGLGSALSSPAGCGHWGRTPAEIEFDTF